MFYGTFPEKMLPNLFDFEAGSIDLRNIFRSLMGLYLAMITLWILGIIKPTIWKTATIANITFMLGLSIGRILSLFVDGPPSKYLVIGCAVELILAFWGIRNLTIYSKKTEN